MSCLLGLWACGASSHPPAPPPSTAAAAAPLFPPGWDGHWLDQRPIDKHADEHAAAGPTDADRSEFADVAASCAKIAAPMNHVINHGDFEKQLASALGACPQGEPERYDRCSFVCRDALHTALLQRHRPPGPFAGVVPTVQVSTPPPAPVHEPDTFERVLRECIERVRDSGGDEPAKCRFDRPLDEMDFGQRHCDAQCAAVAGGQIEPPK
jgi:hypothetical protein